MPRILAALAAGLLFGAGLLLADMVNPARVLAFLDLAGDWDPTLALVMGSALVPAALAFAVARKLRRPALDSEFHLPARRDVDARLVAGAALFGMGWGLVGFCPGPALAGAVFAGWHGVVFLGALLAGMAAHRALAAVPPAREAKKA